jgi:hypothetical protein
VAACGRNGTSCGGSSRRQVWGSSLSSSSSNRLLATPFRQGFAQQGCARPCVVRGAVRMAAMAAGQQPGDR